MQAALPEGISIIRRITQPRAHPHDEEEKPEDGPLVAGRTYSYTVILSSALSTTMAVDVLIPIPQVRALPPPPPPPPLPARGE